MRPKLSVVGDGKRSIEKLISDNFTILLNDNFKQLVSKTIFYLGYSLTDIPETGEEVLIDIKYRSALRVKYFDAIELDIAAIEDSALTSQLSKIGKVAHQILQASNTVDLLYSVDGILDEKEQLWVLEANSNPLVHPICYRYMLTDIFGISASPNVTMKDKAGSPQKLGDTSFFSSKKIARE